MEYIVVKLSPSYHQMSLDDLLNLDTLFEEPKYGGLAAPNITATRTYCVEEATKHFKRAISVRHLIQTLKTFNEKYEALKNAERSSLYYTFHIPKKSGGLRRIDAPNPELMEALRELKRIFEEQFGALYHTAAFAYVKNRSTLDAVKKHQQNKSKWFAKYDLSNFFGSTTEEYTMKMLSMIFPFSQVVKDEEGRQALADAINLAFLDGGLPQGTPISPLITNLIMIPVDYELSNKLKDYNKQKYIYTRYADDFIVSSEYDFDVNEIESIIKESLNGFGAPFNIKSQKTRYGSSSGSNWNLGVMLNKDNEITIGYKAKRRFAVMLFNYAMDRLNGKSWELNEVQVLEGYRNYYRMVEKDHIDNIIHKINNKLSVNVVDMMKEDLRG